MSVSKRGDATKVWREAGTDGANRGERRTLVSGSTSRPDSGTAMAETSGTYWSLRSRSSSWSLNEMPRTGPFWMRFIRWVVKPAILFRRRFEGMMATSSAIRLLVLVAERVEWRSATRERQGKAPAAYASGAGRTGSQG
jgi:hypothetical protein